MNNLEKIGRLKADILPRESSIGKGILAYYSADNNTAIIRLQVNKDHTNLLLGEANVRPMISLFFADGSKYINQEMTIYDALNGVIEYKLSDEQLMKFGKVNIVVTIERIGFEDRVYVCNFNISVLDSGIETLEPNEVVIQVGNVVELRKQLQELQGQIDLAEDSLKQVINKGLTDIDNRKQDVISKMDATKQDIETTRQNVISEFNGAVTDVDNKAKTAIETINNNSAVKKSDYDTDKTTINQNISDTLTQSKAYTDTKIEESNTSTHQYVDQTSLNAESNAKVYTDNLMTKVNADIANNRATVTPFTDITFKNGFSNVTDTVKWSVYRTISHGNGLVEVELFINVKGPFAVGRNVIGILSNNIAPKRNFSVGGRGSDNEPLSLQIGTSGEIAVYVKNTTTYADGKFNYYLI